MKLLDKLIEWFEKWVDMLSNDPVKHCEVYKTKGCSHVDGCLCDMGTCEIRKCQKSK